MKVLILVEFSKFNIGPGWDIGLDPLGAKDSPFPILKSSFWASSGYGIIIFYYRLYDGGADAIFFL